MRTVNGALPSAEQSNIKLLDVAESNEVSPIEPLSPKTNLLEMAMTR